MLDTSKVVVLQQKVWIKSEEDLNSMYETYLNEQEIGLWCLEPEK